MTNYLFQQVFYYMPIEMYQNGELKWMFASIAAILILYMIRCKVNASRPIENDFPHHCCEVCGAQMAESEGLCISPNDAAKWLGFPNADKVFEMPESIWVCNEECANELSSAMPLK